MISQGCSTHKSLTLETRKCPACGGKFRVLPKSKDTHCSRICQVDSIPKGKKSRAVVDIFYSDRKQRRPRDDTPFPDLS